MDATMTKGEITLARRVIDLRGTNARARRNRMRDLPRRDMPAMAELLRKGHAILTQDGWYRLTGPGIQQLKLQIGEFGMTRSLDDLVRGRPPRPRKPITIRVGRGVMSKDGRTPWAAGTIHATSVDGMMYPCVFSHETVARLLADDGVVEIQVIDENNVQSTISKNWIERRPVERPLLDFALGRAN